MAAEVVSVAESTIHSKKTLLWSNPGNSWGTDTITLSSADYNELEVVYKATNGSKDPQYHMTFSKGCTMYIFCMATSTSAVSDNFIMGRTITWNSDTRFTPSLGQIIRWGATSGASEKSYFCFPIRIYGIK